MAMKSPQQKEFNRLWMIASRIISRLSKEHAKSQGITLDDDTIGAMNFVIKNYLDVAVNNLSYAELRTRYLQETYDKLFQIKMGGDAKECAKNYVICETLRLIIPEVGSGKTVVIGR